MRNREWSSCFHLNLFPKQVGEQNYAIKRPNCGSVKYICTDLELTFWTLFHQSFIPLLFIIIIHINVTWCNMYMLHTLVRSSTEMLTSSSELRLPFFCNNIKMFCRYIWSSRSQWPSWWVCFATLLFFCFLNNGWTNYRLL